MSEEDFQPRLHLDHELTFSQLNSDLLRWHQALEPFGSGNLLGLNGEQLDKFLKDKLGPVRNDTAAYSAKFKDKFTRVMEHHAHYDPEGSRLRG